MKVLEVGTEVMITSDHMRGQTGPISTVWHDPDTREAFAYSVDTGAPLIPVVRIEEVEVIDGRS